MQDFPKIYEKEQGSFSPLTFISVKSFFFHSLFFIVDDAIKITSELHNPIPWKSHLHNKKKKT